MGIIQRALRVSSDIYSRGKLKSLGFHSSWSRDNPPGVAFAGEFGYLLVGLLPFLLFLKQQGVFIRTGASTGLDPFFYFSDEHVSSSISVFSSSWGEPELAVPLAKSIRRISPSSGKWFIPLNGDSRRLVVSGQFAWDVTDLHREYSEVCNWVAPEFPQKVSTAMQIKNWLGDEPFLVVNIREYYTQDTLIPNFYFSEELIEIARRSDKAGLKMVLNWGPVGPSDDEPAASSQVTRELRDIPVVIDSREIYGGTANRAEANELQIELFRHAEHIFATQGGNGYLAAMLNNSVTVLLRGGSDYHDFEKIRTEYNCDIDYVHGVRQARFAGSWL